MKRCINSPRIMIVALVWVFQQDSGGNPVEMFPQRNGLDEVVLRRFIDGIMNFGDHGQCAWFIALCYDDGRMHGINFRTQEDIGADRTDGFMTLLTGSI
jgi:hypothetical protein